MAFVNFEYDSLHPHRQSNSRPSPPDAAWCRMDELTHVEPTAGVLMTGDGVVVGQIISAVVTLSDPRAFGGSDELKAHLHNLWAAELARDLARVGL